MKPPLERIADNLGNMGCALWVLIMSVVLVSAQIASIAQCDPLAAYEEKS